MKNLFLILIFAFFCLSVLSLALRGNIGNPNSEELNRNYWSDEGPLELSPERGRYALTYSVLENKSVHFSLPIARFTTPDLGYIDGKYASLFAPGVSYLIMPGYLIGQSLGFSQVGAFAVISLFALVNVLLLRAIAIKLGANHLAATISSFVFIFATPAFTYAVSLYQHHISTFLILLSVYLLLRFNNIWSLGIIWILLAASILIDYPNLFLMLPIGFFALGRFIRIKSEEKFTISIKPLGFLTLLTVGLPLSFFLWFNNASYGNPLQFSGTIKSVKTIDDKGQPIETQNYTVPPGQPKSPGQKEKSSIRFFNPRDLLAGFNTHLFSLDRGIIFFTPVILLGIIGAAISYREKNRIIPVLLGIIGFNVLLYSMWGDPYGGWAFGSRYLIPSYAILSIFLALTLTKFSKNKVFILLFLVLAIYSIAVNTLGAVTSSRNPPKVEAVPLNQVTGRQEKYTYERNWEYLLENKSKSFLWRSWAGSYLSAREYYLLISSTLILVVLILTTGLTLKGGSKNDEIII